MEDWRQLKWASSKLSKNVKELKPINSRDSKSPVTFWHGLASSLRRGLHKLTYNTIRVCPRSFLQIRETRRRVRTDSMCAVCRAVTITSRAKNKKKKYQRQTSKNSTEVEVKSWYSLSELQSGCVGRLTTFTSSGIHACRARSAFTPRRNHTRGISI